jgi:hypothetical protein
MVRVLAGIHENPSRSTFHPSLRDPGCIPDNSDVRFSVVRKDMFSSFLYEFSSIRHGGSLTSFF